MTRPSRSSSAIRAMATQRACAARSRSRRSPRMASRSLARAWFDPVARHRAVVGLRVGRPARARRERGRRPGRRRRSGRSRRRSRWRPASDDRSGSRSPGTCPWSSSVPDVAGGSATRGPGAGPATAPSTSPRHALARGAGVAARDRGLAGAVPRRSRTARLVRDGALQRALLPRRRRLVLGGRRGRAARSPRPTTWVGSPCSSAWTTRSTTPSTSTSTRRSRCSSCSRSWSSRGIRDLLAAIPVDDPEIVPIEASGLAAPRKVGGTVPHDVGGPADDPFVRPNWYTFQDVNGWKDLGPKFVLQAWRDAIAAGPAGRATR